MPAKEKKKPSKKSATSCKKAAMSDKHDAPKAAAFKKKEPVLYIVGMGSSAGGLEALQQFFDHMPEDPRFAFVVVSHLDPQHTSLLPELLQKHTSMKVQPAEDGLQVQHGQVYVMPPDSELGIMNGTLQLIRPAPAAGPRAPINYFLRSLALDQRERAICVILSGAGTDGTEGLKAVKAELGMAMVQNPVTANYDGMPRSALQTSVVDFILPPEEMPEKLLDHVENHIVRPATLLDQALASNPTLLNKVFMTIRSHTGHDFSGYKKSTLLRRIDRRMNVQQIGDLSDYVNFLLGNAEEARILFKELLIAVTGFFRDHEAFEALNKKALIPRLQKLSEDESFRAWVVGCSHGEEAYSLAILIQECRDEIKHHVRAQIFATDIDQEAVVKARYGAFSGEIAADVSAARLRRFFEQTDNSYRVKKEIRDMVVFAHQSVIKDPPFTKLDLICCRNLLIYLDSEPQKKLIPLFHYSLKPGGILFLGASETIGSFRDLFGSVDEKWRIFERKEGSTSLPVILDFPLRPPARSEVGSNAGSPGPDPDLTRLVERKMLHHFTPPCVIINSDGDIRHVRGRTAKYLEFSSGKPSLNIFEIAVEGLRPHLDRLVKEVISGNREATYRGARIPRNGDFLKVDVTVSPLASKEAGWLLMVVFQEAPPAPAAPAAGRRRRRDKGAEAHIQELEQELQHTKEDLRNTVEELETANEELRPANEQYQSNNEELQSANEELSSSKEELQSLNEELESINHELQDKNMELAKSNLEMDNLLDSMAIPTIFLDRQLCIKKFTFSMNRIMNLKAGDVGRPFDDLAQKMRYPNLIEDAREVLDKLDRKEIEAATDEGRWYMIRIRPYKTAEQVIEGVVLTFYDLGEKKLAEMEIDELRTLSDNIVDTMRESLLVLDEDLKVARANRRFYDTFGTTPQKTVGRYLYDLGEGHWSVPRLRDLLERILPDQKVIEEFEVESDFPGIGCKKMRLNARRLARQDHKAQILLAIEDVTGRG